MRRMFVDEVLEKEVYETEQNIVIEQGEEDLLEMLDVDLSVVEELNNTLDVALQEFEKEVSCL